MALIHRKHTKKDDPENGDAAVEAEEKSKKEQAEKRYEGDEYEVLLRYVEDQAKLAEDKDNKGKDDEENKVELKRVWYAPWKKVPVNEKEKTVADNQLNTDPKAGLGDSDIEARRKDFGFNELAAPSENQFIKFISYFRGPILYSMELAVILAAGLRDWIDFGVIIGILVMNAVVGWWQEKQAGDIVASLKAGIALKATVIRNGSEKEIEARELVPGDIIVLSEGNTIPAEAKILGPYGKDAKGDVKDLKTIEDDLKQKSAKSGKKSTKGDDADDEDNDDKGPSILSVDQSAITGESLAVDKYIGEVAFYTCQVKRGQVYAVVTAAARQSFVGKTATLVMGSNDEGHFQIVMRQIGTTLLVMVIFFIFAVWIGGFFRGLDIARGENNLLVYALIFLIIGVPVGLPVVSTTTLAVGASYLARRKCIVQKLTAIESLAGVDILCSDKTGTLTSNKLSLNDPFLIDGVDRDWFMTVAVLASSHNVKLLDPIDLITIQTLRDYPGAQENLSKGWSTQSFAPFDPVSKRITAEVSKDGKKYTAAKGAPSAILKLKSFDPAQAKAYKAKSAEFATRGFRSLGVAVKEDGKDWELLGIMSMSDPPRSDTAKTIAEAQELGVGIKMLTGDAVAIGKELAKQLHLGTNIFDSQKLIGGNMSGSDVNEFIERADGFAEVFPEHKHFVVASLQGRGHLVAMTGDGVNDAPSLKKADCGIAVEGASDAARSAADVVFLDEGLSSIVTSFKVARQIFHRLKAYIIYRIALCIHLEVYLMLSAIIIDEVIRVDLVVFLAIFADVATIAIAYDNAPHARAPVNWNLPKVWIMSTVLGLLLAAGTWICRATMFTDSGGGHGIIQNFGSTQEVLFLEVTLTESWLIFITRLAQDKSESFVWPSWQLVGAVFGVDILASFFCLFGWISGAGEPNAPSGWTSIVDVIRVWCFSFGVTLVVCFFYFLLTRWSWLDSLGQKKKVKNTKLENLMMELTRMSIVHGKDDSGDEFFSFQNGGAKSNSGGDSQNASAKKEASNTAKNSAKEDQDKLQSKKSNQSSAEEQETPQGKDQPNPESKEKEGDKESVHSDSTKGDHK